MKLTTPSSIAKSSCNIFQFTILSTTSIIFIILWNLSLVKCLYQPWEQKIPYCQNVINRCDRNRNDKNFVPYYDSKCYCDFFCKQISESGDCCPDFDRVCNEQFKKCFYFGREVSEGHSLQLSNISCVCVKKHYWQCSAYDVSMQSRVNEDLIKSINHVNFLNSSKPLWTPAIYKVWLNHSLNELKSRLFGSKNEIKHFLPLYDHDPDVLRLKLPSHFDLRKLAWPVGPVRHQRLCATSHIISSIDVAADRFARQPNIESIWNRTTSPLSIQFPLSCGRTSMRKCGMDEYGVDETWKFLSTNGDVTERCYPYSSGKNGRVDNCRFPYNRRTPIMLGGQYMMTRCSPRTNNPSTKTDIVLRFGSAYRMHPRVIDIQYEMFLRGPVQATIFVCPDFIFYRKGIYEQSIMYRRDQCNYQSVRMIGWGRDDNGRTYWICVNSWGTGWGENGYFRIYTGQCEIEKHVITTWGHGEGYFPVSISY